MLTLTRYLGAAAVGYFTAELLVALGLPLDAWAEAIIGGWLGASKPWSDEWLLSAVGLFFAVLLMGIEAWWQPVKRGWQGIVAGKTSARPQPFHDTWLQDAVFYITHGRWLKQGEEALTTEEQSSRAAQATSQIRELAGKGRLTIWGKMTAYESHQAIPCDYWTDHQIDTLHLLGADRPEEICTERVTAAASWDRYHALMVSKAQIENNWPPKTA